MHRLVFFAMLTMFCFASPKVSHAQSLSTQGLVEYSRNATLSSAQMNERMTSLFGARALPSATRAVELWKVRYRSRDERGRSVTLSGLVALPQTGAPKGLVVFNHGTTADRAQSPSRYKGQNTVSESQAAILALASGGYAVAMPDYLGLGDHEGAHPYPLGQINARSAIDMLAPAREMARRRGATIGTKLFVTGYSEGGAVAMWTVRVLEREGKFRVGRAAPLSGPYDLSGVTRQSLLRPARTTQEFYVRLYFLSYIVWYEHKQNNRRLVQFFRPAMADTVFKAFGRNLTDVQIIQRLALTAALMRANRQWERVLTPQFYRAMKNNDPREPIVRALKQNDTYDWTPRTPMLLVALQNDTLVTSQNTVKTVRAMRSRGVGANLVRQFIIRDDKLNHVTAMPRALVLARRFFDGGFDAVSDSV